MGVILWESTPKARKLHLCSCCRRFINPGEEYDRARILGDDGPYTWKQPATPEAREHKRRWAIGWRHGGGLYPVPEIVR